MFMFCFVFAADLVRDAQGALIKALALLDLKLRAAVRSKKNNTDCGEAENSRNIRRLKSMRSGTRQTRLQFYNTAVDSLSLPSFLLAVLEELR